ncbi:MAG: DUF4248 domain-containing protein [Prevotellaceae bacterium]|nr:DUF4248 domain-containing protein [Prevotellaceae bacterium]
MDYVVSGWLRRGCSVKLLSQAYSPQVGPRAARQTLWRWVAMQPGLLERLRGAGWQKGQHLLTPLQVRLIVDALGEPG